MLLPFTSLRLAFPCAGLVRGAIAAVDLLIEMAADDRARKATTSGDFCDDSEPASE